MQIEESIQQALTSIEETRHVYLLYVCESGSRAWGFASPNSDYDVRLLYVRPRSAYLRLDVPRDVIELPIKDDLDINGWDIFKALRLLRKSNPPLIEWLLSPIVYRETSPVIEQLRTLARQYFAPSSLMHHYIHMARGNWKQYLCGKSEVLRKKYLYVLRPLVVLLYLEQKDELPPTNFLETLASVAIDEDIHRHICALIEEKQAGNELSMGAKDSVLHAFIEAQMARDIDVPAFDPQRRAEFSQALELILEEVLDATTHS